MPVSINANDLGLDSNGGVEANGRNLRVKIKASEGIGTDANGAFVDKTQGFAWTGAHTFNSTLPTSSLTPSGSSDLVTKTYADAVVSGLSDFKDSVRVATTGALPANTAAGSKVGKTLTANANGALSIDGVAVLANERVLVKNEATGANNGIYTQTTLGDASTKWVLTRATDADEDAEVTAGMYTVSDEGTSNLDTAWVLSTNDPITVDTTALVFTKFSALGQITAGAGLTKTGNTLDIVSANAGIAVGADNITLTVRANEGLSIDGSGLGTIVGNGIKVTASGVEVDLATNPGLQFTTNKLDLLIAANEGLTKDAGGLKTVFDTGSSGQLSKSVSGMRVATGGAGSPVKWLTIDVLASNFTVSAGVSTQNTALATPPDTHANSLDSQELFKSGTAVMVRVSGSPAATNEWRINASNKIEINGDITASGDTYRLKYLVAV